MRIVKLVSLAVLLAAFAAVFPRVSFAKSDSQIFLQPSFQQLPMKAEFSVDVIIKAGEPLVGADVKLNFDPRILEVSSIDNGDAFARLPLKAIKGNAITITGLEDKGEKFVGTGRLVTLHFKAKDAGDTKVKVAFDSGSTTDSNLTTPAVKDVLAKVDGANFQIGTPLQRNVGAVKRFLLTVIPVLIFLIIAGILAYLAYRWWKKQKEGERPVFIPGHVPLDQPPSP